MLDEVVYAILVTMCPEKVELPLCNSILDPVVPHDKALERFMCTWAVRTSWTVELSVPWWSQEKVVHDPIH